MTTAAAPPYPDHLRREVESYLETLRFADARARGRGPRGGDALLPAGRRQADPARCSRSRPPARSTSPIGVLPFAAALELIHTYSLIHDDLPAMDDDDLRRGRPTCHRVYGEDVAILAGDGLYAEAFRHVLQQQEGDPRAILAAVAELAAATGVDGMVGGQFIDIKGLADDGTTTLRRLHELKTGRLIGASVDVRTPAGRGARNPLDFALFREFAAELGVLFQIVDDILDVTGTDDALGKPHGSDERHGKLTYVSSYGLDGARAMAAESHAKARARAAASGTRPPHGARAHHRLHLQAHLMTRLLDSIDGPQDLHGLSEPQLQQVAQEVRELLIDTVGEIGGHFGANLGACEIAVAVHSLLDSPRDKVLWDVGHQAYPHKVLTGRRDRVGTIRQYGGLAPFCAISESEHDIMGAGHASTSIGYGVGIKEAMRRGDAPGRPRRRRHRRRRDDRRRRLRGGQPGRRARHAARRDPQRQRHVASRRTSARCRATSTASGSSPHMWKAREGVEERLTRLPGDRRRAREARPAASRSP